MQANLLWLLMGLLVPRGGDASEIEKKGKSGYCPTFPNGLYMPPCRVQCEADRECSGNEKCCESACNYVCLPPIRDKPGLCPSPLTKKLHGPLMCDRLCTEDSQCAGTARCCETGCGQMCSPPLEEKAGKCPRKQRLQSSAGCFDTCIHDQECPGSEKCCFDGCAMKCFNFQTDTYNGRVS